MKNFFPLLAIVVMVFISSCNGKTSAALENTSPNGQVHIKLTASRSSALDAFKTEMTVKAYDFKEGKLLFEVMAGDLTNENVKFDWKDDNNCIITIEEQDKHLRTFQLIASNNQVQLGEI
ncbi:MAG TPA: hypothetical protein VK154_09010 [Chitinophagales bacterium]|nr:hypothetical protein [Chitinophagales bacterium]